MNKNISEKTRLAGFVLLSLAAGLVSAAGLTQQEELGRNLYFDTNLSLDFHGKGQACESCHTPVNGFVDPDSNLPVSEGVIKGLFGGRNAPSASYAMFAPPLQEDPAPGSDFWIGGQFWDGRATGNPDLDGQLPGGMTGGPGQDASLGDPLADQARGPFLNPVEMANTSKLEVIKEILVSKYARKFKRECGPLARVGVDAAYDCMALAIAAFERTKAFAPFSSKYDAYLRDCTVKAGVDPALCATGEGAALAVAETHFTPRELLGMQLFMNPNNDLIGESRDADEGAACVLCHVADWAAVPAGLEAYVPSWVDRVFPNEAKIAPPVFTDFSYDNLGVPVNPEIAELNGVESMPIDNGLGAVVGPQHNGKFKVMGLRNIAISEPYAHNGFFKSLKEITHFYNTRDVVSEEWPAPEVSENVNDGELGNLGLSEADEDAIVEFMQTLTDGYQM